MLLYMTIKNHYMYPCTDIVNVTDVCISIYLCQLLVDLRFLCHGCVKGDFRVSDLVLISIFQIPITSVVNTCLIV